MDAIFEEIRSAASAPPSPEAWEAMCASLDAAMGLDPYRALTQAVPMTSDLLNAWPDAQRPLPARWLWAWMDRELGDAIVALARVLRVERQHMRPRDIARVPELCDHMRATELHLLETHFEDLSAWDHAPFLERLTHLSLTHAEPCVYAWLERQRMPALTHLDLSNLAKDPDTSRSPHLPWLGQLVDLDLTGSRIDEDELLTLLPHLSDKLTTLHLGENALGARALGALASAPRLTRLRHLHMPRVGVDDDAIATLAATQTLGVLETLDLRENRISGAGVAALAKAETLLSGLRTLNLHANRPNRGFDDDHDANLRPLGASPHIDSLERLDVSDNMHSHGLLEGLATNPVADLRALNVRLSSMARSEFERFTHVTGLRALRLGASTSTGNWEALSSLLDAPACQSLEALDLSSLDVDRACIERLLSRTHDAPLRSLWLESACLQGPDFVLLLGHPRVATLTLLDLQNAVWSPAHASSLLDAPCRQTLRRLNLDAVGMGDADARTMMRGVTWPALETLDLSRNDLTDATAHHLAAANMPRLHSLRMRRNRLTTRGLETLLQAPWFPNLRNLDLSQNDLTDAPTFAHLPRPCALETLNVEANQTRCDRTLTSIAQTPHLPRLQALHICGDLSLEAASDIAQSHRLRLTALRGLRVQDPGAKRALSESPHLPRNLRESFT